MLLPLKVGNATIEITDFDTVQHLAYAETSNLLIRPLHTILC